MQYNKKNSSWLASNQRGKCEALQKLEAKHAHTRIQA